MAEDEIAARLVERGVPIDEARTAVAAARAVKPDAIGRRPSPLNGPRLVDLVGLDHRVTTRAD